MDRLLKFENIPLPHVNLAYDMVCTCFEVYRALSGRLDISVG